jgi:hypothetical protein
MMWFRSLLASLKSRSSLSGRPHQQLARRSPRLAVENLEDRSLPSSYSAANVPALIADINKANNAGGANTITLTAPTTSPYVLKSVNNTIDGATGLPLISANDTLTIVGNGDTVERSTAGGTPAFRLLDVAAGASLTVQNLTLQGGLATGSGVSTEGGAIDNQGALTLLGVTVENNIAQGLMAKGVAADAAGGGIYSGGSLSLQGSTLRNNQALGSKGAWGTGPAAIAPGGNGFGGGVYVASGTATLTGDSVLANVAGGGEGGVVMNGFGGPSVGGSGGNGFGGALEVAAGTVTLTGDTLSSDLAKGGLAGGEVISGDQPATSGSGFGGALHVSGGTVNVVNSTLSSNTAQGANGSLDPGNGFGGGLEVAAGMVTLTGDTLSSNLAKGGTGLRSGSFGDGGGIDIEVGAVVYIDAFTLANVINNTATYAPNIDGIYIPT